MLTDARFGFSWVMSALFETSGVEAGLTWACAAPMPMRSMVRMIELIFFTVRSLVVGAVIEKRKGDWVSQWPPCAGTALSISDTSSAVFLNPPR